MSQNISTQPKPKKTALSKACKATFILAIIGTVFSAFMTILPVTTWTIGIILLFALVFIILICSVCTAFIIWASDGFKGFIDGFWSVVEKCFTGGDQIWDTIRQIFPYLALVCLLFVVAGFVVNLVAYRKDKDNIGRKRVFVATIIMLVATVVLLLTSGLLLYLPR